MGSEWREMLCTGWRQSLAAVGAAFTQASYVWKPGTPDSFHSPNMCRLGGCAMLDCPWCVKKWRLDRLAGWVRGAMGTGRGWDALSESRCSLHGPNGLQHCRDSMILRPFWLCQNFPEKSGQAVFVAFPAESSLQLKLFIASECWWK